MIKLSRQVSSERLDELKYDGEYAQYLMDNADPSDVVICNGDSLLEVMESEYLWNEFLASRGIDPVAQEDQVYSPYIGA
jgi:hypothetical protein